MSSLTSVEKRYLERVLEMSGGYVLDFTDATFGELFNRHKIDIHSAEYLTHGPSKAKKMRAFWEHENDNHVGRVLTEMLDNYEASCDLGERERDVVPLEKGREIVARLFGKSPVTNSVTPEQFLSEEFKIPSIVKLPVESSVSEIIQHRLSEAQLCLSVGAYLSAIFQCGSVLEAVLLGAALKEPEKFNRSLASPKKKGKVKPFQDWSLSEFINVSLDVGLLRPDVQKFSHGLRDFRNYIHPYEQMFIRFHTR